MACADEEFVDIGLRGRAFDPAHRGRLADVVDLADDRKDRAADVRQGDQVAVDREAAAHHPVVRDELLEQFGDSGPRPRDPALRREEATLLLPRQQRLAVVQLTQEVESRLGGLDRVEHLEPGARQPPRDVDAGKDVIGHEIGGTSGQPGGQVHRQRGQRVDRRPERDDAGEVLGLPVGRGLIGEHPALGVAGKVHVAAGDLLDGVDRFAQRDHMVGEVALHATFDLVGRAEVDDPRVDARLVQDADGAVVAGDVPHVRRHHHRVHHQHRRARRFRTGPGVGREIAPEPVHRHALDDLKRRRHRAGLEAAVPEHFQPVLRGGHQPAHRPGYRRQVHDDPTPLFPDHSLPSPPKTAAVIMAQRVGTTAAIAQRGPPRLAGDGGDAERG